MTKNKELDAKSVDIKFVTLHDLIKGSDSFRVKEREEPLKITSTIERLVGQILDEYKNALVSHMVILKIMRMNIQYKDT